MNGFGGEQLQSRFSVAGGKRFKAVVAEIQLKQASHLGFVFDDENGWHGLSIPPVLSPGARRFAQH